MAAVLGAPGSPLQLGAFPSSASTVSPFCFHVGLGDGMVLLEGAHSSQVLSQAPLAPMHSGMGRLAALSSIADEFGDVCYEAFLLLQGLNLC